MLRVRRKASAKLWVLKQKIIIAGAGGDLAASLEAATDLRAAEILSAPSWSSACALHQTLKVDLVVVVMPLNDLTSDELVGALSTAGLPHVVAIAGEEDLRTLSQRESVRLTILPAGLPVSELVSLCSHFVRASPRVHRRIMARLEVKTADKPKRLRMVQIRDLSATGMKIATSDLLPPGTWVKFSFNWPGDPEPITGDAEVMRHTSKETDGVQGMGTRFTAFDGHSGQRLREHIRQRIDSP